MKPLDSIWIPSNAGFSSTCFTAVAILDDLTTSFLPTLWTLLKQLSSPTALGSSVIHAPRWLPHRITGSFFRADIFLWFMVAQTPPSIDRKHSSSPIPATSLLFYRISKSVCLSWPGTVLNVWVEAERMRNSSLWFVGASTSCPQGICNSFMMPMGPTLRRLGLGKLNSQNRLWERNDA